MGNRQMRQLPIPALAFPVQTRSAHGLPSTGQSVVSWPPYLGSDLGLSSLPYKEVLS